MTEMSKLSVGKVLDELRRNDAPKNRRSCSSTRKLRRWTKRYGA
jgi:hypothetical protein